MPCQLTIDFCRRQLTNRNKQIHISIDNGITSKHLINWQIDNSFTHIYIGELTTEKYNCIWNPVWTPGTTNHEVDNWQVGNWQVGNRKWNETSNTGGKFYRIIEYINRMEVRIFQRRTDNPASCGHARERHRVHNTSCVRWAGGRGVHETLDFQTETPFRYDTHDTTFQERRFLAGTTNLWRERASYGDRYSFVRVTLIFWISEDFIEEVAWQDERPRGDSVHRWIIEKSTKRYFSF